MSDSDSSLGQPGTVDAALAFDGSGRLASTIDGDAEGDLDAPGIGARSTIPVLDAYDGPPWAEEDLGIAGISSHKLSAKSGAPSAKPPRRNLLI